MKKMFVLSFFCMLTTTIFGQSNMRITLTDGTVKSGIYKFKDNNLGWTTKTKIISKKTKEKYNLKDVKSLILYTENDSIPFEVIQVKKYLNSSKKELKLGQVAFKGDRIDVFYVSEYVYQGWAGSSISTVGSYHETYLKRKNNTFAYNMGYLYGAGQRGVKKRVREFFNDCPELVQKVDSNEIPKKETLQIALFYEKNCSE